MTGGPVELRPDPRLAARLRLVGAVSVLLGFVFAGVVVAGGGPSLRDLTLAAVLFVVPFVWAGGSFLCEARLLPQARVRLADGVLHLRLVDPRPFRLGCAHEESRIALAEVRAVEWRRRSMLEVLLLSAMRPRGSWSREALVILGTGRTVELDPAVWPDLPLLHRALAGALEAREEVEREGMVT